MSDYVMTLRDITAYVVSKQPEETVGNPGSRLYCLVARALAWKYPELTGIDVSSTNVYAYCSTPLGSLAVIDLAGEVEATADAFDRLRWQNDHITRKQLEESMPELFEQPA